ncbi:uncharacterized protein [Amphiura filiformis]|uniref:uncharacterized protein n=1 Tax=Amphiura filiformis TaxID=82378 RepID=UPI003B214D10
MTTNDNSEQTRVILWSVPRATSTAFEMSMNNVSDSIIWHEPYLCAMWWGTDSRFPLPGSDGWAGEQRTDLESRITSTHLDLANGYDAYKTKYSWVKNGLEQDYAGKRLVFCKAISYGATTRFDAIPDGFRHTFLIRHPYKVLPSWKNLVSMTLKIPVEEFRLDNLPESTMPSGYAFKESYDVLQHVKQQYEANPIIIDADDLLNHPKQILQQYCQAVNIPYSDSLLRWTPGPGEVIAKDWRVPIQLVQGSKVGGWYEAAFASSGWQKDRPTPSRSELSSDILACADAIMPYYEEMYKERMIPQ